MENTELATISNDAPDFSRGMYCSVHAETQEDRLDIYEAVSNSMSLDDMVGKTIEVENVIIQPVEMTDHATGEQTTRNRIVLISPNGDASDAPARALKHQCVIFSPSSVARRGRLQLRSML